MPLSREDFVRASRGEPLHIPAEVYGPVPTGLPQVDHPDVRRAVDWFKSYISPSDWIARRDRAFVGLYSAAYGVTGRKGRFFDDSDTIGWYLFLADAFLDHPWNYEPMFGSRVVPLFAAIGRDLDPQRT